MMSAMEKAARFLEDLDIWTDKADIFSWSVNEVAINLVTWKIIYKRARRKGRKMKIFDSS